MISKSAILKIRGTMEIAHRLPNYDGKCSKLHGHRIDYTFSFKGEVGEDGMVEDFKDLERIIKIVVDRYDHSFLNDFFENPTLEDFAMHLLNLVDTEYCFLKQQRGRGKFVELEMWETNKYGVVVTNE